MSSRENCLIWKCRWLFFRWSTLPYHAYVLCIGWTRSTSEFGSEQRRQWWIVIVKQQVKELKSWLAPQMWVPQKGRERGGLFKFLCLQHLQRYEIWFFFLRACFSGFQTVFVAEAVSNSSGTLAYVCIDADITSIHNAHYKTVLWLNYNFISHKFMSLFGNHYNDL